jgi:hypothetical protein
MDDEIIDELLDGITVVGAEPSMDKATLYAFCIDTAQRIHDYDVIARRYGFGDEAGMVEFLRAHPPVVKRVKELRAVWESDESVELRLRKLAGHSLLEALPDTASIMFDKQVTPGVRLEALRAHARIAGVDTPPHIPAGGAGGMGGGGAGGGRFSVQIVFNNSGRVETITASERHLKEIEGEAEMTREMDTEESFDTITGDT